MEIIKNKYTYNECALNENCFAIAFGIDDEFVRPLGVLMTSIINNNKKRKFVFYIISKYISEENKKLFKQFSLDNNVVIYLYIINEKIFSDFTTTSYISRAMYNRFLIPLILKDTVDKVLYLDADIICLKSITSLETIDMSDKIIAVIEESNDYVVKAKIKELNLKSNKYFNSGVLYINVKKWLNANITNKLLEVNKNFPNLSFPDQDLLNIVLENECIYIDKKYNYTFDVRYKTNRYIYDIPDEVVFLHYVGRFKPWQEWCLHPIREKFRMVAKQSLWNNVPWDKPLTYKNMKNMAKSNAIYKHYIKALYWYFRYAIKKIITKIK